MTNFAIPVQSLVRDKVTLLEGIVTARSEHLHGCLRYNVQPQGAKDGKIADQWAFDEAALEVINPGKETTPKFKYELGSKVKDKITGYEGVIVTRSEFLFGDNTYAVQSLQLHEGKPIKPVAFSEGSLDLIVQAEPHKVSKTGGPGDPYELAERA